MLETTLGYVLLCTFTCVIAYYPVMQYTYFLMYHIISIKKLSPLILLLISSEFDRFLAERAKAAERLPSLSSTSQDNQHVKS